MARKLTTGDSPCLLELLISHDTIFFPHNKTALAGLSTAETTNRTGQLFISSYRVMFIRLATLSWHMTSRQQFQARIHTFGGG
jgi:hypothetical protein